MRFGSVCSGIEAASVAWNPLGWRAAWLSEIEAFPSAVLAHYPDVPNLGDMSTLPERIRCGEVEAPDVFCGGTPCQAFSVAGLRRSLDDARGNLSLTFCEIANAIDAVRLPRGKQPAIIFWENVPGVLNTKDNAFGCFLAGLAGEDDPLIPPGKKWSNAGAVYGPKRAIAWRVLDAQYFGVAQRRRRVFVVASARTGFDPAAVLFEFDGVRRDTAPSREAREVAPTIPARSTGGGGLGTDFDCDGGLIAHTLRGEGFDASEDGTGRGTPLVPVGVTIHGTDPTVRKVASYDDVAQCLRARTPGNIDNSSTTVVQQPVAFAQNSRNEVRLEGGDGQRCGALSTGGGKPGQGVPMIAFHPTQDPISSTDGSTHALGCGSTGGQASVAVAVAVALRGREGGATAELGDEVQNCLRASSGGGDKPHVLAPVYAIQAGALRTNPASGPDGVGVQADHAYTLEARAEVQAVQAAMQVRRLTPRECERLQGFPDDYTLIPTTTVTHRKGCEFFGTKEVVTHGTDRMACGCKAKHKPADQCPDGPRYKALGNSWAVPNVRWIGQRIADFLDAEISALI